MKKLNLLVLMFSLFFGCFPLTSRAQETEAPTMFVVYEEFVSPSNVEKFNKVQTEAFEQMKKHEADFTFWAYQTENNSFYWVMPIMNFAALDKFYEKSMKLQQKMKEDGYDGAKKFRDLSTMTSSIILWSKDLSYNSGDNTGQTKEKPYCEWTFCYLRSGHEKEATEALKEYVNFYNNSNLNYNWDVYRVMLGQENPCWIMMVRAENEIALRELEKEINANHKEDNQKMWQNFAPHVRKIEKKRGWFLPGWSMNLPE